MLTIIIKHNKLKSSKSMHNGKHRFTSLYLLCLIIVVSIDLLVSNLLCLIITVSIDVGETSKCMLTIIIKHNKLEILVDLCLPL
jgi:hypothetical protein